MTLKQLHEKTLTNQLKKAGQDKEGYQMELRINDKDLKLKRRRRRKVVTFVVIHRLTEKKIDTARERLNLG